MSSFCFHCNEERIFEKTISGFICPVCKHFINSKPENINGEEFEDIPEEIVNEMTTLYCDNCKRANIVGDIVVEKPLCDFCDSPLSTLDLKENGYHFNKEEHAWKKLRPMINLIEEINNQ